MKKLLKIIGASILFCLVILLAIFLYNTKVIESHDAISTAPAATKFLESGGETFAYQEIDNQAKTTIVFVGGLSAWAGTWERVVQEMQKSRKDFNYVALDLPPFGYGTTLPGSNYFRDTQASRIGAFLEAKNIHKVILVAHSYGAGPVTEYVIGHQANVEKLIIIDGLLNVDEVKTVNTKSIAHWDFLRTLALGILIHNDSFGISRIKSFVFITDNVNKELFDIYTRYFTREGTTARLSQWFENYLDDPLGYKSNISSEYKKLVLPVRLIWGDKDTITPIEDTKILLETVPDIRLTKLIGVGHIPMIEDYAKFDEALLEALSR